jgi:protein TonB
MRFILAFGLAVCVASSLFWLMNYLILGGSRELADTESYRMVDFVRLQPEEDVQTRQRSRPEPPPPDEPPPPPPQLQVQQAQTQSRQAPEPFDMPKLNVPTSMTGGPFMGELAGGGPPGGDGELIPLVRLAPQYPRQAARAGISGWVRLRITVNPDGSVRQARVVEAEPRGLFEASAVTAAMRGRFRPRMVGGEAIESSGEYIVNFQLGE